MAGEGLRPRLEHISSRVELPSLSARKLKTLREKISYISDLLEEAGKELSLELELELFLNYCVS